MRVRFGRVAIGAAIGGAALIAAGTSASAHVTVDPGEGSAGERTLLTFAFSHGCDGSATTEIRIQIPESIPTVAPTINPGWDASKEMETLETPIEASHGEQITERVAEVIYTAKAPIPDGFRDTFVLSLTLPDTPGETIYFPTIQTCETGETAWIEIPDDGQSADDLEAPAPAVEIVESTPPDSAAGDSH